MSRGFISYSHVDNQPAGPHGERWVETFHRNLHTRIDQIAGAGVATLWFDHRLTGNEDLSESIRNALRQSEYFFAIVSPNFQNSDWCPSELREFLQHRAQTGRETSSRVFHILKENVPLDKLHERLQAQLGYQFIDRSAAKPVPMYSSSEKYWLVLEDIARDFCMALEKREPTAPNGTVYIPECSWDDIPHRAVLRRELEAKGYAPKSEMQESAQP